MFMFAIIPYDVDTQLAFKYRSLLLKEFLSFTISETDTADVNISEPHPMHQMQV